jgi:tetratricopeptide (TPR) repeat protein
MPSERPPDAPPPARNAARRTWNIAGVCAVLLLLVWGVFGQTMRYGFINYDDMAVYQTPEITRGLTAGGIGWAFTHSLVGEWIPLTTITHMIDSQVYGPSVGGRHLTNVLLHCAVVIMLFLVLEQMTGALWRAAFVAAIFAIHPLRAESVAWITERKDVLSGLFFMLTLRAYARYVRRPDSRGRYAMVLVWFLLGLLSKPMLVTVPFLLILLDYWPLRRLPAFSRLPGLLKEKIPLFACSIIACVGELFAARRAIQPIARLTLLPRLGNALVACVIYIGKLIHPSQLAVFYPMVQNGWAAWQVIGALLLLAGLTWGAWALRRSQPYLLVGWLWYLGMLVPVIGIVQTGVQAYADRFTYLPQIGLCLAGTWAAADWASETGRRRLAVAGAAAFGVFFLAVAAARQTAYWRDSVTLWTHTLASTPDNALTRFTLGDALGMQGRTDEAIAQYRQALRLQPDYVDAHNNLGLALAQAGQSAQAIAEFREALRINPDFKNPHNNLGDALAQAGKTDEAIEEYRQALRIDPEFAEAHYNLGKVLAREGRTDDAIAEYRAAVGINPDYADAQNNLGIALAQRGQTGEAIEHLRKALELEPTSLSHQNNLAWLLATAPEASLRDGARAVELAQAANEATGGANPGVLHTLAAAYAAAGDFPSAVSTAQQALQTPQGQSNPALGNELRRELALYQAGRAYAPPAR